MTMSEDNVRRAPASKNSMCEGPEVGMCSSREETALLEREITNPRCICNPNTQMPLGEGREEGT